MQCSECSVGSIFYVVAYCLDSVHYPLRIWLRSGLLRYNTNYRLLSKSAARLLWLEPRQRDQAQAVASTLSTFPKRFGQGVMSH